MATRTTCLNCKRPILVEGDRVTIDRPRAVAEKGAKRIVFDLCVECWEASQGVFCVSRPG